MINQKIRNDIHIVGKDVLNQTYIFNLYQSLKIFDNL